MERRLPGGGGPAAGAVYPGGPDLGSPLAAPHAAVTGRAEQTLRPLVTALPWIVCLFLAVWAPLFPAAAQRIAFYPFALGLVLFGLPHGALDHRVIPHLGRHPQSRRSAARFVVGYLAAVLLYLLFWHLVPLAALAVFLGVSWLHWGQGDYAYLRLFEHRPRPRSRSGIFLIWLVRGGLPIALPIIAWPATFARVSAGLTHWFGGSGLPAPGPGGVTAGISLLLILTLLYAYQAWRDAGGATRGFWRDVGELALLWVLFWRVPPVLAVGTYFCVWHSVRHLGRLMLVDPVTASWLSEGRLRQSLARTALQCVPMTLGAIALLGGLYAFQHHYASISLPGFVFLYLSLVAALTVPHFAVVLWMDHRQGLYQRDGNSLG